jgi:hypothetical protein
VWIVWFTRAVVTVKGPRANVSPPLSSRTPGF